MLTVLLELSLAAALAASAGPSRGALVVVGGGRIGPEIAQRFVALAGGPDAEFVVIPTAAGDNDPDPAQVERDFVRTFGVKHVTVLHTHDRAKADTEEFVLPLRKANAVWFPGGRQWRLVDAYLNTRTEREIRAVLDRGGVIGGSSAGATIQGSYLVRGAREGNTIMMAKGYEQGFGYLKDVAVDQHVIARHREDDLVAVIQAHPELLGIGIDESTAIVVQKNQFEVIGASKVGIYDGKDHEGKRYYFISPGTRFDLETREVIK
jgi:cyanophycinase